MDTGALILNLITIAGLLIPILSLVWKAAKQAAKIEELEKRVNKLEDIDKTIDSINISIVEIRKDISFMKEQIKGR